jgi:hypothetical protein
LNVRQSIERLRLETLHDLRPYCMASPQEAVMANALARLVTLTFFVLLALWAPVRADDPGAQARALIQSQLDAFGRDDAAGAYALASPGIRSVFTDSGTFMDMVRSRYAPVYRHRSAEFQAFSIDGDQASQVMTLVDEDNEVWTAIYKLERQPDGSWLISGCLLTKAEAKDT